MSLSFDSFHRQIRLTLKGNMSYQTDLGTDVFGNITRINNAFNEMPIRLNSAKAQLENLYKQIENAEQELKKPFTLEAELNEKMARLAFLDAELSIDGGNSQDESLSEAAKSDRSIAKGKPSILETLRSNSSHSQNASDKSRNSDFYR